MSGSRSGEEGRDGGRGLEAGSRPWVADNRREASTGGGSESERSDSSEDPGSPAFLSFRIIETSEGLVLFQHRLHAKELAPSRTSTSVNWRKDSIKPFSPKGNLCISECAASAEPPDEILCSASVPTIPERRSHGEWCKCVSRKSAFVYAAFFCSLVLT